ncbi:MAG: WD40 repeat domain-containing protein [Rhodothermales bacterium]
MTRFSLTYFVVFAVLTAAGCSAPQPSDPSPEPAIPQEPTPSPQFDFLAVTEDGLVLLDDLTSSPRHIADGIWQRRFVSRSPSGNEAVIAFRDGDSTRLARVHVDEGRLRRLHASTGDVEYTAAWAPDAERVLFGYRSSGSGDVAISTPDGLVDPGCSSSTVAAHWPDADRLVTGDGSNRYVVSADGCSTFASVDVRKMHHLTYPTGGRKMAYIFRDLVYDRENRSYVPDSTLFIADLDGSNAEELFDDAYKPRHLAWSPDGSTLAFDVRLQEAPNRRRIVLKELDAEFTYLIAPTDFADADVERPVWSPSGRHVAFDLVEDGSVSKAVRSFGGTDVLTTSADSTWGWVDDETLVVVTDDDSLRGFSIDGEERFTLAPETALILARGRDVPGARSSPSE